MLDSVGIKKIEEKNKQFLIEKIIHGIKFENLYTTNLEKKPEILPTIERNYKIAGRVYQQLHFDTAERFAEFIKSYLIFELQDLDEDIRAKDWE